MKRIIRSMTILLLVVCAQYGKAEFNVAEFPPDFRISQTIANSENEIILSGYVGKPSKPTPIILCSDDNGKVLWKVLPEDKSGIFSDIACFTKDQFLAIRQEVNEHLCCYIDIYEEDKLVNEIQLPYRVYRAFSVVDGVILFAHNEFDAYQLVLITADGSIRKMVDIQKNAVILDITQLQNEYVAVGYTQENNAADNYGFAAIIDNDGNDIQSFYSSQIETYKAVLASDDGWYIIGDTYDPESTAMYSSMLFFSNRTSQVYHTNNDVETMPQRDKLVLDAVLLENGCMIAIKERKKGNVVIVQCFDKSGGISDAFEIDIAPIINVQDAYIFAIDDMHLLVATGYCEEDNYQKYKTVIKHIKQR